jgi:16S rRNA processing protein RimM
MQKIIIGKVIKPVGLKGEIKVIPLTDNPERFKLLKEISIIEENGKITIFEIEKVSIVKKAVNLKFKGINTKEQAQEFKNKEIGIDENQKFPLQDGYYYIHQILGLKAVDEEGELLGEVKDVLKNPGNDIFVINKNNKDYLIPAVKEFIAKIDLNNGKIIIKQIDGLFD